jgi:hypothetical protein
VGKDSSPEESGQSCKRLWVLETNTRADIEKNENWEIKKKHFSFTICGVSDFEWMAYAFTNEQAEAPHDDSDESEEIHQEDDNEDDSEHGDDDDDEIPFTEDPIVSDGQQDAQFSRDPREYFLKTINVRLPWIIHHYKDVITVVQVSMKDTVSHNTSLICSHVIQPLIMVRMIH